MNRKILLLSLSLMIVGVSQAQEILQNGIEKHKEATFKEIIPTKIAGAPVLGQPQLIEANKDYVANIENGYIPTTVELIVSDGLHIKGKTKPKETFEGEYFAYKDQKLSFKFDVSFNDGERIRENYKYTIKVTYQLCNSNGCDAPIVIEKVFDAKLFNPHSF